MCGKDMKKFYFSLLWTCNERCLFCAKGAPPRGAKPAFTRAEAFSILEAKRKEGYAGLSLDGGEPSLLTWLPALLGKALALGYRDISVMTNGAAYADRRKAADLAGAAGKAAPGVKVSIPVSLHSHRADISSFLTGTAGMFHKTLSGIHNLLAAGANVHIYHLITSLNYKLLPDFARFTASRLKGVKTITFSYIYPGSGNQGRGRAALYPEISKTAPYLLQAIRTLGENGINYGLSNCGLVPLCMLKGLEGLVLDAMINRDVRAVSMDTANTEEINFFLEPFNKENKTKGPACRYCALGQVCWGMWKFYAEKYGLKELAPVKAGALPRSGHRAGAAKLRFRADPDERSPVSVAKLKLLAARIDGFSKADLRGSSRLGPEQKKEIRVFARRLGVSTIRFTR